MKRILFLLFMLVLLMGTVHAQASFPDGQIGVPYFVVVDPFCAFFTCNLRVISGSLPPGLALDATSISGIPTQVGVFIFMLSTGGPAQITIQNGPPAILPEPLADAGVGTPYSTPVTAVGGTPPYKWSVEAGSLPSGLSLQTTSGGEVIAGTPTAGGFYLATLHVVDANGLEGLATLQLAVAQMVIQTPISALNPNLMVVPTIPAAKVGTSYLVKLSVQYGSGTFAISAGSLPPGLVLDSTGTITGTPTVPGTFAFTLTAGNLKNAVSITVVGLDPLFSTTSLPGGTLGRAYFQKLDVAGGLPPYAFTATGLPPGLALNGSSGSITGTPAAAGTFPFAVTAADASNHQATVPLPITIYPPPALTTASPLPPATAGQPYSQTISVSGGQPPYTFILSAVAPPGLALSSTGKLSGTAITAGSFTFTIQVTDNLQNVVSQSYQLTVAPLRPTLIDGGILNSASFAEDANGHGTPVAPGSLVSLYGSYPGAVQAAANTSASLPASLGGVGVTFNGVAAPLEGVYPSTTFPVINAQIPAAVLASSQSSGTVDAVVTINGIDSTPQPVSIAPFAPGIFTIPPDGLSTAILVYVDPADGIAKIAAPSTASTALGFPSAPIPRGASGYFYVTGLGAMTPPVVDGDGGGSVTHFANQQPAVFVGGVAAPVIFAGQAPGYPGIGQVNITIPATAPAGSTIPLQVKSLDGTVLSNIATIAVR